MLTYTTADLSTVETVATYSGGAWRIPVHLAHAKAHAPNGKQPADLYLGTSCGALVAVMAAQGKLNELVEMIRAIDDRSAWNGNAGYSRLTLSGRSIWTAQPLLEQITKHVRASDLIAPVGFGVVCRETGQHHVVVFGPDSRDEDLRRVCWASSLMAGVFEPTKLDLGDGPKLYSDGGHRYMIPLPELADLPALKTVHVSVTRPTSSKRRPMSRVDSLPEAVLWALDMAMHNSLTASMAYLRGIRKQAEVIMSEPDELIGGMLQADRGVMRKREIEGAKGYAKRYTLGTERGKHAPRKR